MGFKNQGMGVSANQRIPWGKRPFFLRFLDFPAASGPRARTKSGFPKRGSRKRCLPVWNGRKREKKRKKTEKIGTHKKNSKKGKNENGGKRNKTEKKNGKKSEATPIQRPLLRDPDHCRKTNSDNPYGARLKKHFENKKWFWTARPLN